ncbi:hypothetical protein H4217_005612 [Coemansia sp. RSA 1939]|nr:hypothetical protein H4217_005612 [Coemansia sp. RSA 1939]
MATLLARRAVQTCARHNRGLTLGATRQYTAERHSSLAAKVWVLTNGDPVDAFRTTSVAAGLQIPFETKHAVQAAGGSWVAETLGRPLRGLGSLLFKSSQPGALRYVQDAAATDLPRIAIAASREALPGLLEVGRMSRGQSMLVYLGVPQTRLSNIDVLVLSQLDRMRLRELGPGRANLDNAATTLLPFSGVPAKTDTQRQERGASSADDADSPCQNTLAVCIGQGIESGGFRLLTRDVDVLAEGLMRIPSRPRMRVLLPRAMNKGVRRMVESHLIRRLQALRSDTPGSGDSQHRFSAAVEVLDYSLSGQPSPVDVIASASRVVATADNLQMMALAVSLGRPVYIAGEERTTGVLRSHYHALDSRNLVRRFYPVGSKYDYMLMADIDGAADELSVIRDHDPWAKYDAQRDLDDIVSFIRMRYKQIKQ